MHDVSVKCGNKGTVFVDNTVDDETKTTHNLGDDTTMNEVNPLESFDSNLESIYTSNPKKTIQCEECLDTSACIDCFVKHTLGKHGIARAIIA